MSKRLGEERVGEERTTLEGERVRIVCYFTSMDIRVEFEDGTQVKTTYLNFRRGDIRYPLKMKRLKEHGRAKDGSATRIIAYRCSTDIDVLFENGEILEHTTYPKFRNGTVQQPSRQRRDPPSFNRTGETKNMPDGKWFQITAYRNDYDMDVTTETGAVLLHVRYEDFKKGFPAKKRAGRHYKDRTGERRTMISGESAVVTATREHGRVDIRFDNGSVRNNVLYNNFYRGILTPSPHKKNRYEDRIGEERMTPEGARAVCTDYRTAADIRVECEDGRIWEHTNYYYYTHRIAPFTNSGVPAETRPRTPKEEHIGERMTSRSGKEMEIVRYINVFHVVVRFLEDNVETTTDYQAFRSGLVRHPDDKSFEGKTALSKEGEVIRVLTYRDKTDMDVIFEDGTTVEHVTLSAFSRGWITRPGSKAAKRMQRTKKRRTDRVGESVITIHGEKATIIEYIDSDNMTIQFENGVRRDHVPYNRFSRGLISQSKPKTDKKLRLGEEQITENGEHIVIIAYRSAGDIDVRFDNGIIRNHVTYHAFKKGKITQTNRLAAARIGEQKRNRDGQVVTCIGYRSVYDIDVRFPDGTTLTGMPYGRFKRGLILHPGVPEGKDIKGTTKKEAERRKR